MYQKASIIGNLGTQPEMRYTPSGQAVVNFNVATSKKKKGNDGINKEHTTWFRVSVWGNFAEAANQYLNKGDLVFIEGELLSDDNGNPRIFTKKNGEVGASFEIAANFVKFLKTTGQGGSMGSQEYSDGIPF